MRTNNLNIEITESVETAPSYKSPEYLGVDIEKCLIVPKGTENGNPTVDIVFVDAEGKKYVTMLTGQLLETLGRTIEGVRLRGK